MTKEEIEALSPIKKNTLRLPASMRNQDPFTLKSSPPKKEKKDRPEKLTVAEIKDNGEHNDSSSHILTDSSVEEIDAKNDFLKYV